MLGRPGPSSRLLEQLIILEIEVSHALGLVVGEWPCVFGKRTGSNYTVVFMRSGIFSSSGQSVE